MVEPSATACPGSSRAVQVCAERALGFESDDTRSPCDLNASGCEEASCGDAAALGSADGLSEFGAFGYEARNGHASRSEADMGIQQRIQRTLLSIAIVSALCCRSGRPGEQPPVAAEAPNPNATEGELAPAAAEVKPARADLAALFARERPPLPRQAIADPKGRWRAEIEARTMPVIRVAQGAAIVRVDVGTQQPLVCQIHDAPLDPGVTVSSVLGGAKDKMSVVEVTADHISAVHDTPVLVLTALYATKQKQVGEVKIAVSPRDRHAVVCMQDEPGYRAAFVRTVEGLLESLESDEGSRLPQYVSVSKNVIRGLLTGYEWRRIYAEPDGTMLGIDLAASLAPIEAGEVRVASEVVATVHDRQGITKVNFFASVGGEDLYEVEVQRSGGRSYSYSGRVEQKDVSGRLEPDASLRNFYEVLIELQKHRPPGESVQFRQEEYQPRSGAQELVTANYSLSPSRDRLTIKDGDAHLTWSLDDGLPTGSRRDFGETVFDSTVLVQRSSLGSAAGVSLGAVALAEPPPPLALAERRRGFVTGVFAETSRTPPPAPPPKLFSLVHYPAPLGANAAYVTPVRRGTKRPAVVWIAGGFDWGIGDTAWKPASRSNDQSARAFREAGMVLMLPALRGSHENPGRNECFLGEVEDVIAAAEFLAEREDVDPSRIYLGGHSTGGTLALLAAATTERFRAIFAFGPVADARQYGDPTQGGCLPSDATEEEIALRSPIEFISTVRTPTFVFEGAENGNGEVFGPLRERASDRVHFSIVPSADHFSVLAPGTEIIARAILADRVDDSHLVIELDRAPENGRVTP